MLTQTDYSDVGAAYGKMVPYVGQFAAKHSWSSDQSDMAFDVLAELYEDYSGLDGWARIQYQQGNYVPLQWMLSDDPDKLAVMAVANGFGDWLSDTEFPKADKLAKIFYQAGTAAQSELTEDTAGDVSTIAGGGATGAVKDARSLGTWTADTVTAATTAASSAAKDPTSRKAIAIGAAALAAFVVSKRLGLV
tara:strand:+ start:703 stop:1278 length:576 start_codon:yes stop_codon:yes gene_type:complete